MTIKQAAMWLCQPGIVSMIHDPTTKKALSVAVKALAEPKLGTNLAEVGTDCISRQAAIEAVQNRHMMLNKEKVLLINDLEKLPPAQPETTRRIVGKSKGGMTLWYECERCGEPVDEGDKFCRGCGAKMEVTE